METMKEGQKSRPRDYYKNYYRSMPTEMKRRRIENVKKLNKLRRQRGSTLVNAGLNCNLLGDLQSPSVSYTKHTLKVFPPCPHCGAFKFEYEPPSFCCAQGKITLVEQEIPEELYELFTSQTEEGKEFRKRIRAYNNIFSFTSFGVSLDSQLASSRKGVYTFQAQGQVYHDLPSLIPSTSKPCFFQLYFYDTNNEIQHRSNVFKEMPLDRQIIQKLMNILSCNPYAQFFRRLQNATLQDLTIGIRKDNKLDQRVYNAPSADQVAAIWIEGNNPTLTCERDIIVHAHSGQRHRIRHYYGCYDPLQYPLLFPFGESGWHQNIKKKENNTQSRNVSSNNSTNHLEFLSVEEIFSQEQEGVHVGGRTKVSCREYYCYKLQIREAQRSILLLAGRLFQQYAVDEYIKLESTRLDFYRTQQSKIRAELYQGIVDSVQAGELQGSKVGKRIILPASFIGGPRDMRRRYMNAMGLVHRFGKPDFFITITCNPEWEEIQLHLTNGQTVQDRPDLVARVFRAKLQDLKDQIFHKHILGRVAAHVHVIEFQKRGLPHAHMLVILHPDFKVRSPDDYDKFVCAEIPDQLQHPELHEMVVKHMMHGPYGILNDKNSCMKNGKCKSHYPRPFSATTMEGENSYPIYRRRENGPKVYVRKAVLDNRWVVPYNPYLLFRYNCHINVEICSNIKAVKYLYKYIYKGHDRVSMCIASDEINPVVDEIQNFQDARWVSAQEAVWRLFEYELNEMYPSVFTLQLHLPNKQTVTFWENQNLENVIESNGGGQTMLVNFFETCSSNENARQYLYREFPDHYVWDNRIKKWKERKQGSVIGRLNAANPTEGERYYLRLLLNHVRGPTSFDYLLTYDGVQYKTFKEAAEKRGLLQGDNWVSLCLHEAALFQMPSALRCLFATILVFCEPADVRKLWDEHVEHLSEAYQRQETATMESAISSTLNNINYYLQSMGKRIQDYDLPSLNSQQTGTHHSQRKKEILEELNVQTPATDLELIHSLNVEQLYAFNEITNCVKCKKSGIYFIDGPGGTGKTFLYRALLAQVRSKGEIAIATATSGVAASILPGGRTAHSRFKIPLNGNEMSTCNIPKQSGIAEVIRRAKIILWDEAPMAKRWAIEAVDRSFQDIMNNNMIFGGKLIVLGGDFRQVLPVVPRGSRAETVDASLARSYLWPSMTKIPLTRNMRANEDPFFSDFLLRVGNGEEPSIDDDMIEIPKDMLVANNFDANAEQCLIDEVYPLLKENAHCQEYIASRAILATKNEYVDMLNEKLIDLFPGDSWTYNSFDEAIDDNACYYPEEFLNSLTPSGMPPHHLTLKLNCPIMLLRNIDPANGLCNGTRLVCKGFKANVVHAEISCGQHKGKQVLLTRIPLMPADGEGFPFNFKRMQLPIRLSFAMTINKAQGQTIPNVGVYLPQPVFSHGQLYVALSLGKSMRTTRILLKDKKDSTKTNNQTRNIVYNEVLSSKRSELNRNIEEPNSPEYQRSMIV